MTHYGELAHSDLAVDLTQKLGSISRMKKKEDLYTAINQIFWELTDILEREAGPYIFTILFSWITRESPKTFIYTVETTEARLEKTGPIKSTLLHFAEDHTYQGEADIDTEALEPELILFTQFVMMLQGWR
jgi:hypothetical protein